MTSHELAKKLLELPDLEIKIFEKQEIGDTGNFYDTDYYFKLYCYDSSELFIVRDSSIQDYFIKQEFNNNPKLEEIILE